jgi:hypothetical protein
MDENSGNWEEKRTARWLGVGVGTLRRWRAQDRGPRYRKIGALVRYVPADVAAFLDGCPGGGGAEVRKAKDRAEVAQR